MIKEVKWLHERDSFTEEDKKQYQQNPSPIKKCKCGNFIAWQEFICMKCHEKTGK